jgi:membrane-bound serine protease (ClpP class)
MDQGWFHWNGALLLLLAALFLFIELKYYTHMISGLAGTILLAIGALLVLSGPYQLSPGIAIGAAVAVGAITIFQGFLGMRARKARQLTGIETLVGEEGVAQTNIDPEGMVMIRGEYWRARSDDHAIAAGRRVAVKAVKNLLVYVREA